ncbi:MAG: hypothetical protein IPJ27_06270 [Candidatus Accumulibacter sp.]|uniref:DUF1376 domain-containing protein n=1 Tax=Candidatus Accumulibacter proximus TaxID=2954385 RepID=A0A935PW16_9PROT|nr:hypothetical protein [Candidatus Accumulibacter proximus]
MRKPPAYQEYAATMLADSRYRLMSLAERGLLDTLKRECWVNVGVPANPAKLAKMLSFEAAEIDAALPAVMQFFAIVGDRIICPELEDLRATYADRRERQAAGGKRSAEKRSGGAASTLQATPKHPAGSLQVRRQDKTRQDQSKAVAIKEVVPCAEYKDWMSNDDPGGDAAKYQRMSDGE